MSSQSVAAEPGLRQYEVKIPIAGHAFVTVEATSEDQARELAFDSVCSEHIEEWEALEQFNKGNVCYCPHPWQVEVEDLGDAQ